MSYESYDPSNAAPNDAEQNHVAGSAGSALAAMAAGNAMSRLMSASHFAAKKVDGKRKTEIKKVPLENNSVKKGEVKKAVPVKKVVAAKAPVKKVVAAKVQ